MRNDFQDCILLSPILTGKLSPMWALPLYFVVSPGNHVDQFNSE